MKRPLLSLVIVVSFFLSVPPLYAAVFERARISQIVNKVNVLKPAVPPRPAQVNERISGKTAVRTGVRSRSELVFPDDTVTRLGSNTFFSFRQGSRDMTMKHGVMLLQAPKGAGGAKITTGAVTAAITGTTIVWEVPPPGTPPDKQYTKLICIEAYKDGVRFFFNDRPLDSIIVPPGYMIIVPPGAKSLLEVQPVPINIKRLLRTSLLINGLSMDGGVTPFTLSAFGPVISGQEIQFSRNELQPTNLVIDGIGTSVLIATDYRANTDKTFALNRIRRAIPVTASSTAAPTASPTATAIPTAKPTGTPSKFDRPPLIADPDPYTIFDSTVVQTDPSITTNGATDFGKIYRNEAVDGSFTNFVFGSTTEIDTLAGLNTGRNNTAVFKFSNLTIAGSPIFDTTGGSKKVFLAALNDINSSGFESSSDTGTTLNLSGLTELGLIASGNITLDGSVNFITTDNVSQNLVVAARGAAGSVSLANTISGSNLTVDLAATDNLQVQNNATIEAADARLVAGKNVTVDNSKIEVSSTSARAKGGTITVTSSQADPTQVAINITNSAQLYSLLNSAVPGPGGTITVQSAGGQIIASGADIDATNGTVDIRNNGAGNTLIDAIAINNGTRIAADVVKIGALGANGVLNIQAGSNIDASTLMRLYGGAANGQVRFSGNGEEIQQVNLSANQIDIAAKTVTIDNNVTVATGDSLTNVYAQPSESGEFRQYNKDGFGSFSIGEGGKLNEQPISAAPGFDD